MRITSLVLASALVLGACKKKGPAAGPTTTEIQPAAAPAPLPTAAPEPTGNDGSADAPAPEPEPAPAPQAKSESKDVRKSLNSVAADLETTDVARLRTALDKLDKLADQNPDEPLVHLNIGVAQHKLGNSSAAKAAYDRALEKDPNLGHAYFYLGALKEEAGDLTGAETLYRRGMQKDPENVDVRVGLVSTLRKQGRMEEVIAEAQKALKVNALSTEIYNDVGLAYQEQEKYLLAKFMYLKALNLPKGEAKAFLHANLGWTRYLEGNTPAATESLKKAVDLDPEYVPGLVYLARVYMQDRNYADTVDLLERASRHDPTNHGVQMNLGIAYRGVNRNEDARRAYERALELDPSNPDPHLNLGILYGDYFSPKDYTKAVEEFELYKSTGGADVAVADGYIEAVNREKKRVQSRAKSMEAAKKRDAAREERERLAKEQEEKEVRDAEEEKKRQEKEARRLEEEQRRLEEEKSQPEPAPAPEPVAPEPASSDPGPDAPDPEPPDPEPAAPEPGPAPKPTPEQGGKNPWGEQ